MRKRYAVTDLHGCYELWEAIKNYCKDVKTGDFPSDNEVFKLSEEEAAKLSKEELLC